MAQNNPKYKGKDHKSTYDKVHPEAKKVEGDINGITIGQDAMDISETINGISGTAYENFTTKEGKKMHKIVVIENGKIVSVKENSGSLDINKLISEILKKNGN